MPPRKMFPSDAKAVVDKDYARIRWVFRCNAAINDEPDEITDREEHAMFLYRKLEQHCGCFAFQLESAPTTGYQHYQGYMELGNKKRKKWILDHIQRFEYLAPSKGTPKQAWNYSTKEESRMAGPWTFGEPFAIEDNCKKPTVLFVESITKGATDSMLVDEHPSCFMRHDANKVRQAKGIRIPPPTRQALYGDDFMEVYVFYGNPGTGKSYAARQLYPDIYTPPIRTSKGGNFWMTPDANLAPVVLFDDFDGNLTLKALNQILDPYPQLLEKKGGNVWWLPRIVILTTNVMPGHWYNYDTRQDVRVQINRRITMCFDFNTPEGKAMTQGISVEQLEERYKPEVPKVQLEAFDRMKAKSNHFVFRKPPTSARTAPYAWDHATKTLVKPQIQPRIDVYPSPDGGEVISWDEIEEDPQTQKQFF